MIKKLYVCLIILATLLGGCASLRSTVATVVPGFRLTLTVASLPPLTQTARRVPTRYVTLTLPHPNTPTPLPASPTPEMISTAAIPSEARLKIQCLEIAPSLPRDLTPEGLIIVHDQVNPATLLVNMKTGVKTRLDKEREALINFVFSPNRQRMAYERAIFDQSGSEIAERQLVVARADGQQQTAMPWEKDWVGLPGWLDNERLVIRLGEDGPLETTGSSQAAAFLVLDPFTGKRQILAPDFPEIYDLHPLPYWGGWGETAYNPSLTRVVYLRWLEDGTSGYALWDLQRSELLTTLFSFDFERTPLWSPDGTQFILAANPVVETHWLSFELYGISQSGQLTQLTNLTAYYPTTYIQSYSWSPDGRYIAFWLNEEAKPGQDQAFGEQHLAILDTATEEVVNYCVPGDQTTTRSGVVPPPIWSPDSQQLIVEDRSSRRVSRVILVDIVRGFAAQIAENMEPVGWMASTP